MQHSGIRFARWYSCQVTAGIVMFWSPQIDSCDGRLKDKREDYQNCSVLYGVLRLCTLQLAVLTTELGPGLLTQGSIIVCSDHLNISSVYL